MPDGSSEVGTGAESSLNEFIQYSSELITVLYFFGGGGVVRVNFCPGLISVPVTSSYHQENHYYEFTLRATNAVKSLSLKNNSC